MSFSFCMWIFSKATFPTHYVVSLFQVFIAIALILGDGLYNLIKIIGITLKEIYNNNSKQSNLPVVTEVLLVSEYLYIYDL